VRPMSRLADKAAWTKPCGLKSTRYGIADGGLSMVNRVAVVRLKFAEGW